MELIKTNQERNKSMDAYYDVPDSIAAKYPELSRPTCMRETKYGYKVCGACRMAQAVAAGTRLQGYTQDEAIEHQLRGCSTKRESLKPVIAVTKQIRRDGQRILQAGTNVYVQPDKRKGTKRYEGWVVECYSNNTVSIYVPSLGDAITVEADEFIKARRGTTEGRN